MGLRTLPKLGEATLHFPTVAKVTAQTQGTHQGTCHQHGPNADPSHRAKVGLSTLFPWGGGGQQHCTSTGSSSLPFLAQQVPSSQRADLGL